MPKRINIKGERYGRLVVIKSLKDKNGKTRWRCRCDCGQVKDTGTHQLRGGNTRSCGCLTRERLNAKPTRRTHGYTGIPEHVVWKGMRARCNNENHAAYKNYGGRGIKVCKRWNKFSNFLADMGKRPSSKHTIERTDNNKNYEPSNCEWVTRKVNCDNRRDTVVLTFKGRIQSLTKWAEEYNIKNTTVHNRLKLGWTIKAALSTPVKQYRRRA